MVLGVWVRKAAVPLVLRVNTWRNSGPQMALHLGTAVPWWAARGVRLEDASGNLIKKQSFKTAPLVGVSLVGVLGARATG